MTNWEMADLLLFTAIFIWVFLLMLNFVVAIAVAVVAYAIFKRVWK
jgi:hypothetical protein